MIYDITPPISEALAVWPGDTPPRREVLCAIESGDNITLSNSITLDMNGGRW
jgi:kynurenine formamidase